jgi:putative DNA methylase
VGVRGVDLVIACVGAGLRPYTRYDRVELPNGEELPAARFLDEVQREVLEAILAAVFHLDRAGVGRVDKASRFYILARYHYGEATVPFDDLNVLARGLGIELTGAGSLSDGKGAAVALDGDEATLRGYAVRGAVPDLGLPRVGAPAPLVDVLHRLLWLLENGRAKVGPFLDEARVDRAGLRLLADALKGRALAGDKGDTRTPEQRAVDTLLAQWGRLLEGSEMPLLAGT